MDILYSVFRQKKRISLTIPNRGFDHRNMLGQEVHHMVNERIIDSRMITEMAIKMICMARFLR
jgi:hypothetical protein